MRHICRSFIVLFAAASISFAGSATGKVKSILTWDKIAAGDPWNGKFIFQVQKGDGATIDLWAWNENKEFISSILAAKTSGSSISVEFHDTQDKIGPRFHAWQVMLLD